MVTRWIVENRYGSMRYQDQISGRESRIRLLLHAGEVATKE